MTLAELRKLARSRGYDGVEVEPTYWSKCSAYATRVSASTLLRVHIEAPTRRAAIAGLAAALLELPKVKP